MDNKKIVWLASYPKSGNTWFRAFITALLQDGELDINNLKSDGIFSSRRMFDEHTGLNSTLFTDEEIKLLQPAVFDRLAATSNQQHLFMKVHDAYTLNRDGQPIIPTTSTLCAIYFIRNPLDIAGSLANHKDSSLDEAIALINNPEGKFSRQDGNLNTNIQLTQLMLNWSGHVKSWTGNLPFPVLVLRYEDMLANTYATFSKALNFIGINADQQQIEAAIAASSFEQLQQKEKEKGFTEKNKNTSFFRQGKAGGWKNELSKEQVEAIAVQHKDTMNMYGYKF
jgi:hypothetical protein